MVKRCCYGLCDADSRYEDRLKGGVYFIPFPKKSNKEKCLKWIKACGRPHSQLNVDKINRSTYICSKHFIDGGPSDRYPDPIPTETCPSITTQQKRRRKGKRLIKSNEKIPSDQLKDEPPNIKRTKWQPSPISLLDPSMDTVVLQKLERNPQKTDAILLRGALEGKSDCHKSQENVTEESGIRKQQLRARALSCGSTFQILKDPTHVFNGEKVQFVKCVREADQTFDGLKKKEVWRLIYDFAIKYNNIIHNPICDFDGLGDSSWFQKFIDTPPNVPIKKKNNSRASQKVNLNSNNVNTLQESVPDLILAGSDSVTKSNIQMDNNKNSNSSPKSCLIKKDHPHVPESINSSFWYKWLHDVTVDNVKDDSVVLNSDVCQGEGSGNYGSNQSGVNGETVTVKEEDFVAMEENSVFVKGEDLLGKDSDSAIIKDISEEENIIFKKNKDIHKEEESIFIKKEEVFEEAYEDTLMNTEGPVCSKKRNSL